MKTLVHIVLVATIICSCGKPEQPEAQIDHPMNSSTEDIIGTLPSGDSIKVFTLTNEQGLSMRVMELGGVVLSLMVPDRQGNLDDVVLGFDRLEPYLKESPYFGALIGRYGNRIAKGMFTLDGHQYQLVQNNIGNHLHGGTVGFDKVKWEGNRVDHDLGPAIELRYVSDDGEEGYPGTLQNRVTYILRHDNALQIDYHATTDLPTIVNLTQHSYFNLNPAAASILDHQVSLHAAYFLPVDESLIPLGEQQPVAHTPFDFQDFHAIGERIDANHPQIEIGGGYDHCWVLKADGDTLSMAAEVYEPVTGRVMKVYTTEPGVQFYTGNFLDGTLIGKKGQVYPRRSGFCLETQHFPDSPNQPDFPSVRLDPGQVYESTTVYSFSTR